MRSDKPNQIVDEITGVIYPPAEAITSQLATIRAIIAPTIKMYESTSDIHTIQPNLDMIQRAINYLRGAPPLDFPGDEEEEIVEIVHDSSLKVTLDKESDNCFVINILGMGVEPKLNKPELFGDLAKGLSDIGIKLPLNCGQTYEIIQNNPALKLYYPQDDTIVLTNDGDYIKMKSYLMMEDVLEYYFLLPEGRNYIEITIIRKDEAKNVFETAYIFKISSHIHYKEDNANEGDSSNG